MRVSFSLGLRNRLIHSGYTLYDSCVLVLIIGPDQSLTHRYPLWVD